MSKSTTPSSPPSQKLNSLDSARLKLREQANAIEGRADLLRGSMGSPRAFIREWCKITKLHLNPDGNLTALGKEINFQELVKNIHTDYNHTYHTGEKKGLLNFGKEALVLEIEQMVKELEKAYLDALKSSIKFDPACLGAATNFLEHFLDRPASALEQEGFKHALWLVKRKMNGLKVIDHIWFNIFSPEQGTGKTTFLTTLFKPLQKYVWDTNVKGALEDKSLPFFESKFIAFCDEIAKVEKDFKEDLKQKITASRLESRVMYTQSLQSYKNNCTFFSGSNESIGHVLGDHTGMRRFFELSGMVGDPLRRDALSRAIDSMPIEEILKVWMSVDESKEDGYLAAIKSVFNASHAKLKPTNPMDEWYEDVKAGWHSTVDLFATLQLFYRLRGLKETNSISMGRYLSGKKCEASQRRVDGKRECGWVKP